MRRQVSCVPEPRHISKNSLFCLSQQPSGRSGIRNPSVESRLCLVACHSTVINLYRYIYLVFINIKSNIHNYIIRPEFLIYNTRNSHYLTIETPQSAEQFSCLRYQTVQFNQKDLIGDFLGVIRTLQGLLIPGCWKTGFIHLKSILKRLKSQERTRPKLCNPCWE